jgi:hypothetical protein
VERSAASSRFFDRHFGLDFEASAKARDWESLFRNAEALLPPAEAGGSHRIHLDLAQGLKLDPLCTFTARLKSCPDTKQKGPV